MNILTQVLLASLISVSSFANTATFQIKTSKVQDACSGMELKDYDSLEVTYLRRMNHSLESSKLSTAKLINCRVLQEAKVTSERRIRRGKVYPTRIRKGLIELEVEYVNEVQDNCSTKFREHVFFFGGITVISNSTNMKIIEDLGISFLEHTTPGLAYGEVTASVNSCLN